ncbi:MAG: hypothetical protein WC838_04225 [Candidatus Margulisiibacteriota bacterium]|jgi:hypothetical protein
MHKEIVQFYQRSYNTLGAQTKLILANKDFLSRIQQQKQKWDLGDKWQKAVLDDYVDKIDYDLRIKTNEENCYEIEEKFKLSPELRFHHGLDRALVDLYIRQELFKENEKDKAISSIDPRNHWEAFSRELKQICQDFGLESADSMFVYRNLLALPLINIVKEATSPNIEISYDPETGINTLKIDMSDDALRYCTETSLEFIKEAIEELKNRKEAKGPPVGKQDLTWYYKTHSTEENPQKGVFLEVPFLQYLIEETHKIFN